ncbi:type II toxin-antitoxin system ParD family antitoxin [Mycobacteroides abscessus]|uniref:type II toxin-antitoxin system ParD family antitoxin n=1 Tax=Mycobacteroides abscessus TaxID=36809 RepID=UPI00089DAE03|nr:hypothetical protein [Mycobacteroides abscessus]SIN49972.1 Conserved protein of uncharacterised function, putative antitoxin RelB2 [Mycobacteroides abscessus subsp. bolletii]SLC63286.1 Conserved protein of uncharacterised function, putative antitoxin RelB2 [Mycobacteroides abscessus subsp. massiliense]MBE5433311.1 hypothetical protein [Mycobacteroides abscessus]MBE5502661.1 hypothetical protein [Mycobacteroides abscessus]
MTDNRSDIDQDDAPRGRPREFRQLPNLFVPQDFDAPLPEDEYAAWEASADGEHWPAQPGIAESVAESESDTAGGRTVGEDETCAQLEALREALIDGECSGESTPFDFQQFVERKRDPGISATPD